MIFVCDACLKSKSVKLYANQPFEHAQNSEVRQLPQSTLRALQLYSLQPGIKPATSPLHYFNITWIALLVTNPTIQIRKLTLLSGLFSSTHCLFQLAFQLGAVFARSVNLFSEVGNGGRVASHDHDCCGICSALSWFDHMTFLVVNMALRACWHLAKA